MLCTLQACGETKSDSRVTRTPKGLGHQHTTGEEAPQHNLRVPNMGSTGDLTRFCGPGGAPGETVAPRQLQDRDVHPGTEAPATRLLPNQKYYIDPKLLGLTPGNLHTWKSARFRELFWNQQIRGRSVMAVSLDTSR